MARGKEVAERGKAVAKRGKTDVVNWKEELAKEAREESARVPVGQGNQIKLDKKLKFILGGADLGSEVNVIIVGHVKVHAYYDTPFDEDNITAPACYAVSDTGENMAPLDESPKKQSEICDECWAFKFKSDERGKGKACGEKHALAVIFTDDLANGDDPEIAFVKVPVTSGATFRRYVKGLNDNELPSWAVMTAIKFDEKADWQKLEFDQDGEVPEKYLNICRDKNRAAMKQLMEKPDFSTYKGSKEAKKPKGKQPAPAKKAGRSRLS